MPEAESEFAALMQRVREGSEDAARELLRLYGRHVLRVVRRRMHEQLRRRFDSLDFVQDVWASFFGGQFPWNQFDRPEALIAFLARMACNKVAGAVRQQVYTAKHAIGREHSLDSSLVLAEGEPVAPGPTPSEAAMAGEEWNRFVEGRSACQLQLVALLRQGQTHIEIARRLGVTPRTVRRLIHKLAAERAR